MDQVGVPIPDIPVHVASIFGGQCKPFFRCMLLSITFGWMTELAETQGIGVTIQTHFTSFSHMTHYLQIVPYDIITDVTMTHADSCLLTYLRHHDSYRLRLRHVFVQHKHLVTVYKP